MYLGYCMGVVCLMLGLVMEGLLWFGLMWDGVFRCVSWRFLYGWWCIVIVCRLI